MQTFPIAPPTGKGSWLFLLLLLIPLAITFTVFAFTTYGARSSRFDVSTDGLRLRGDFYGRLIPARDLQSSDARRVDFATSPELAPVRRTLGTGLPGYQAGWFRLKNGEKALVYLTDRTRAVYVPTTAGYSVIVSPADPDAFLAAITSAEGRRVGG